jgi:glyoxylase-like metal-dependent hydrolase (beta-lactamase superfamily II)
MEIIMKPLRIALAAFVVALLAAPHARAAGLTVTTYSASPAGFSVNSHLIAGEREAILVDAQFTLSEAARAVEHVQRSGKQLKLILVTHGHPDHFFGLGLFQKAFPDARIVATPEVIADIRDYAPKAIARWKPVFGDEIPDAFVVPEPITTTRLELEGHEIQLLAADRGESAHATLVWIPGSRALVTGDLAYGKVHLWLAENRPEGWREIIERLEQLQPVTVYPGHGAAGGVALLAENRAYIEAFVAATAPPATREQAIADLKARYADYGLPVILDFSVPARISN